MINAIEIKNVQSHEYTELCFSSGVNIIIGSSNSGKSAILRALYWVKNNRPLGLDTLASDWIVNDKGYLTKEMSVKLTNDKGVVERRRTKDENQYIVDGDVLNVVKTDVPEQVSRFLNLTDTNVQKQLDAPFLLSQTSGEVAKYFNQMVNLDVIDKVLTNAETKRRKLKSTIENTNDEIDRLEKKLEEFDGIDETYDLLLKFNELYDEGKEIEQSSNFIVDSLSMCESAVEWIEWVRKFVEDRKSLVNELDTSLSKKDSLADEIYNLWYLIKTFEDTEVYDFTSQKKQIEKINFVKSEIEKCDVESLKSSIEDYESVVYDIEWYEKIIKENKAKMPKTCPLCGSMLEDGQCVSC